MARAGRVRGRSSADDRTRIRVGNAGHALFPQGREDEDPKMAQPIAVTQSVRRPAGAGEGLSEVSTQEMYREILSRLGEDPNREGLLATPGRVEKSLAFLTKPCSTWITTRW